MRNTELHAVSDKSFFRMLIVPGHEYRDSENYPARSGICRRREDGDVST